MGNYTPGIIKARGGPPRGQIYNLRGYRVPWSLRRGLVADPRRCTPPRRIEFYGVFRDFVGSSTFFFMGAAFVAFSRVPRGFTPFCWVCVSCGSCAVRAGSVRVRMMVPGGHVSTRNKNILSLAGGGGRGS